MEDQKKLDFLAETIVSSPNYANYFRIIFMPDGTAYMRFYFIPSSGKENMVLVSSIVISATNAVNLANSITEFVKKQTQSKEMFTKKVKN